MQQRELAGAYAEAQSFARFASIAEDRVVVLPIGSFEQHGPHLPLGTDTIITEALVARLVAERPERALALPTLPYSASDEHTGLPGTLSLGNEVLAGILARLRAGVRSARMLVVTAHGGNAGLLSRLGVPSWVPRPAALRAFAERLAMPAEARGLWNPDAHAGRTETSVMLALRPDLVGSFEGVVGYSGPLAPVARVLGTQGVAAVTPSGVLGTPAGASAAEGASIIGALMEDLTHTFDAFDKSARDG